MKTLKRLLHIVALCILGTVLLSTAVTGPILAQNYSFGVPELQMQAYVQQDSSVRIVYDITFENYGSPIDIVDIGLPNSDYNINNMSASVDGVGLSDIRTSEYIDVGVEIHLRDQAIRSGERGTLHFEATMPPMVYEDTTDRSYASLQLTPTWFDDDLVVGTGDIDVAIHLPPGVEPEEARFQDEPFTAKTVFEGRTVVVWQWEDVRATKPYPVGVSFPKDTVSNVIEMSFLDLVREWMADNPEVRFVLGGLATILLAFLFFRFSGGTGCTVFGFLAAGLIGLLLVMPLSVFLAIPALVALVIVNEVRLRKQPKGYLPPIAQVEGGGIKRGLTAPEAATLLEMTLSKVLTLVIFGLLEKDILQVERQEPLTVSVRDPFKTWDDSDNRTSIKQRRKVRRAAAHNEGTVVHAYEDYFLDQIERNPGKPVAEIDFTKAMEYLIKNTAEKVKDFDLSDTQDYYRRVIDRAMEQAQALGEIEQREEYLDKYLPWVMMNDDYPTVLTHRGYNYWPIWASRGRARGTRTRTSSGGGSGGRSRGGGAGGRTTFGDVAGSFAGWTESTMGGLAAAILPGSMNIPNASGGFVDLSGVDRVTGDVFEALSEASKSSGGGGGGGSSCACACAGCACACACAGGGR